MSILPWCSFLSLPSPLIRRVLPFFPPFWCGVKKSSTVVLDGRAHSLISKICFSNKHFYVFFNRFFCSFSPVAPRTFFYMMLQHDLANKRLRLKYTWKLVFSCGCARSSRQTVKRKRGRKFLPSKNQGDVRNCWRSIPSITTMTQGKGFRYRNYDGIRYKPRFW